MRSASMLILVTVLTLGLTVGAMAMGGGMMGGGMTGGWGQGSGWGGQAMQPGYHNGYGSLTSSPNTMGPGSGYDRGGLQDGHGRGYGQGYGANPNSDYRPSNPSPNGTAGNTRR